MSAPFRYVVADMDGTLLGPDHFISDNTRNTLKTLVHEFGVTPILATGRSYADVKIVSTNLRKYIWGDGTTVPGAPPTSPSRAPMMYLLTSNGAVAHNAVAGEVVFQTCVDPALAAKLFCLLPSTEEMVNANVYQNEDWITRIDWLEMLEVHKESGIRYIHVPNPPPRMTEPVSPATSSENPPSCGIAAGNYDNISKIFYLTDDAARLQQVAEEVQAIAKAHGGSSISLTFSASDCMDLMAEGVCKGEALKKLFGIILPPQEGVDVVGEAMKASIAFGDGLNDAEMLTEVGKGCMMGNSSPKLKALHPELETVLSNGEDGVAQKLREVFGLPQ